MTTTDVSCSTMRRDDVLQTVGALSAMFAGDGAAIAVLAVDEQLGSVSLALSFDDIDCEDCVLPPDRIRDVIASRLSTDVAGFTALYLADPRERPTNSPGLTAPAGALRVLDPTGGVMPSDPDAGPDVGPLRGKRVGIRVDVLWPAWDQTVEEWTAKLAGAGATVSYWRRAQGVKGAEGERLQAEYDAFVGGVDVLISGLGNCGSCTSWSVGDALNGLNRGLPSIVGVTEEFVVLGQALAADRGRPGLRQIVLPHSVQTLPESTVRDAAVRLWPVLVDTLGAVTG